MLYIFLILPRNVYYFAYLIKRLNTITILVILKFKNQNTKEKNHVTSDYIIITGTVACSWLGELDTVPTMQPSNLLILKSKQS